MREILFRGKLIRDINPQKPAGSWVYGGYYLLKNGACIHEDNACIGLFVDPETVGEYTGLKDRDGKRIFEGDIIESVDVPRPARFEVVFNLQDDSREISDGTQSAEFCLKDGEGEYMCFFRGKKMRIIGNIHDAPELLKGATG
jgi:uncharacterized phage protein (TIGR01671 family)